jgi:hypothetical protein
VARARSSAKRGSFAFSVIKLAPSGAEGSGRADFFFRSRYANVGPAERDRGTIPALVRISVGAAVAVEGRDGGHAATASIGKNKVAKIVR